MITASIQTGETTRKTASLDDSRSRSYPHNKPVPPAELINTQHSAGNQALQSLLRSGGIQPKLSISHPGDPDELEADRIADSVMRMAGPDSALSDAGSFGSHRLQRKCGCADAGGTGSCNQCKGELEINRQTSGEPARTPSSHPALAAVREALHMPGQPLDAADRGFFEPRFGRDFSSVRIHNDVRSSAAAKAVHAVAFTVGQDVVFAAGRYQPGTEEGRRLLAHELTHIAQQRAGAPALQRQQPPGQPAVQDPGSAAPKPDLTTPITSEVAASIDRPAIVGLLLMIQKQMQTTDKDSPDYQALKRNFDTLQGALQQVCGAAPPPAPGASEGALLVRMTPAGLYVVEASDVLYAQRNNAQPGTSPSSQPAASMPEQNTCEAFQTDAVDRAFELLGAGPGDYMVVYPGDSLYMLARVKLMEQQGVPYQDAANFVISQLKADQPIKGQEEKDQGAAAAAGPLAPGKVPVPRRGKQPFDPKGQPQETYLGNECHACIFQAFLARYPNTATDATIWDILNAANLSPAKLKNLKPQVIVALALRPDILERNSMALFEVKPAELTGLAVAEAHFYAGIFKSAGIPLIHPGPAGMAPSGIRAAAGGWCVFLSPADGAIVYEYTQGNPRRVYEFMHDHAAEEQYDYNYYLIHGPAGVEVATAISALGYAGLLEFLGVNAAAGTAAAIDSLPAAAPAAAAEAETAPALVPAFAY
jgi:hypothetical protein